MRLAHVSDSHIDHSTHAGQNKLAAWRSSQRCLAYAAHRAAAEQVDVFVHPGDAFAHGHPTPEALKLWVEAVEPVQKAGIPIVLSLGNHELLRNRRGQRTATAVLGDMLASRGPVEIVDETPRLLHFDFGQILALPWVDAMTVLHEHNATGMDESDANELVAAHVLSQVYDLLAQADVTEPLAMAAHLTVAGGHRGSEKDMASLFREPVVHAADLDALPFGYVALGHLHTPQALTAKVRYSGSPQRFTFTDEPDTKIFHIAEVSGSGQLDSVRSLATPARGLQTVRVGEDVTIADKALLRVMLRPGERDVPPDVERAVKASGARVVKVERAPRVPVERTEQAEHAMTLASTPDDLLRAWLSEEHPEAAVEPVLQLAAGLAA